MISESMAMWDQGCCGMGNDMSLPTGSTQGTLAYAHAEQEEMNLMSVNIYMLGHQSLALKSWQVHWLHGCPVAGEA